MPPSTGPSSGTFPAAGPPTTSLVYESLGQDGTWNIKGASGVAIFDDGTGVTQADVLTFVGRAAPIDVTGPQSGTPHAIDGWVYKATTGGVPSGHWIFGVSPFQPATSFGPLFIVGFNTDTSGTSIGAMKFLGWQSLCTRK
jgi:hypothetical protein